MLPTFLLIGAAKCGTTSLSGVLSDHPEVFVTDPREIGFFGLRHQVDDRQWYESHFPKNGEFKALGEGSTIYTHPDVMDKCARDIRVLVPDCRLIYMVRHPLKRLVSDWRMRVNDNECKVGINQAVRDFPNIVRHGNYWKNLKAYRNIFSDEQIKVVFLEDFKRDPEGETASCFRHIGVEPQELQTETHRLKGSDLRQDGILASKLRGLSFFENAKSIVPRWVVDSAKSVLTRKATLKLEWDPAVRSDIISGWKEDSAAFLEYCDKPADFWKYDEVERESMPESVGA